MPCRKAASFAAPVDAPSSGAGTHVYRMDVAFADARRSETTSANNARFAVVDRGVGEHRLLCGDATSANDMAMLMDSQLADMVFTDLIRMGVVPLA